MTERPGKIQYVSRDQHSYNGGLSFPERKLVGSQGAGEMVCVRRGLRKEANNKN